MVLLQCVPDLNYTIPRTSIFPNTFIFTGTIAPKKNEGAIQLSLTVCGFDFLFSVGIPHLKFPFDFLSAKNIPICGVVIMTAILVLINDREPVSENTRIIRSGFAAT